MKNIFFLLTLLLLSLNVDAETEWKLSTANSMLSFISTKNKTIREEHTFKQLTGSIQANGLATVSIAMSSLETNIDIRNERMHEYLFDTESHPATTATAQLTPENMQSGQTQIKLNVSLHGHSQDYTSNVMVDNQGDRLIVTSFEPVEINAKDFALRDGINKLTSLAQLQSISYIVPVEFKLVFVKKS